MYATATIQGNRMRQMRQITAQSVIQELEAHFGLGDATKAEIVRVEWPSRRVTEWHNVAAGQILTFTEPTNDLPVITVPMRDQTNAIGSTATFEVRASGTPSLSYQWRLYNNSGTAFVNVAGETNVTLVLTNVQQSRRYGVEVSNAFGAVITQAVLRVGFPAGITQHPASATVELGTPFSLSVVATGAPPSYQWYKDGVALPSQTSNSIYFSSIQTNDAGLYWVTVRNGYMGTNLFGGPTSQEATVRVTTAGVTFTRITNGPVATDAITVWGLAWGDYDNDGHVDLFAALYSGTNALYHNLGNGIFGRVTNGPVASDRGSYFGSAWADFNNDGWLDLFVPDAVRWDNAAATPNHLLYQGGNGGQFTKITADPVVTVPGYASDQVWGDFDNDGYVDLFVMGSWSSLNSKNYLFRNTGGGGFIQVLASPFINDITDSESSGASDFDNDGDLDLLISAHSRRLLYRNNGNGTFTSITSGPIANDTGNSAGFAWGDYDNDGLLDLCLATFDQNLHLFHNDGNGQFTRTLLGEPANYQVPTWVDFNNDGYLDLFVTHGYLGGQLRNRLFMNNGDGTFTELRTLIVAQEGSGNSVVQAWADYDNDGFADLVVGQSYQTGGGMLVYHNNGNSNHWLSLRLQGTLSNRSAIGAKVRLRATIGGTNFWQMREMGGGCSRAQGDLRALFGLGDATNAEIVRIEWPSGQVTELQNVAARQILTVEEPNLVAGRHPSGVQLTLRGRIGSRYDVQTRASLDPTNNWSPWLSVTSTSPVMIVTDTNVSGISQRYYKVVQPQR